MGLYRQKGSKVWWIDLYHNGKRVRKSTETEDMKLAKRIFSKFQTMLIEGKWFDVDPALTRSLVEMKERYIKERSTNKAPSSYTRDVAVFKNLREYFGDCALAEMTPGRINDYKQMRLEKVDSQTVVRELGVLKNAFNVAIKEWEWCRENPVSRITMPRVPRGRTRFLSKEELKRLLECSEGWFRPVLEVAVHTGMRQGNIIELMWDEVDLFKRRILLEKTKNDEPLVIPINDSLMETLKGLSAIRLLGSNRVFHHDGKPLYKNMLCRALKRACKTAGIEDFRFHDLRHTFASMLIEAGEDLYTVQKLLGHKDSRMTQRYAHLKEGKLASAVAKLDRLGHDLVIVGENEKGLQAVTP